MVGVQARPIGVHGDDQSGSHKVQPAPTASAKPSDLIAIKIEIARLGRTLESLNAKQPPRDDSAQRSANAEENGAIWAALMFVVAGIETVVTGFGVFLVWHTLDASRAAGREAKRAADAAEQQIAETRRIGEAEVRAYISIKTAVIAFTHDFMPGEAYPQIQISIQNTGQSPARKFIWRPTLRYYGGGQRRSRGVGNNWVGAPGIGIAAGDEVPDNVMIADMLPNRFAEAIKLHPGSPLVVHLRIEFEFEDVFGTKVSDDAFFVGGIGKIPNGQQWAGAKLGSHPRILTWDTESIIEQ